MIQDVEERQGVWEPWQPQVGQRVRLRISPECEPHHDEDFNYSWDYSFALPAALRSGHSGTIIGLVGGVFADLGHPYHVEFDDPIQVPWWNGGLVATKCAAIELEPIESAPLPRSR